MSNENRTILDQRKDVRNAYEEGRRDGFSTAAWIIVGLLAALYGMFAFFNV